MPPPNDQRRALLTDAAIALLAETGVHGVTHRAVETRAGLPGGTASNYFRSRETLLLATAERIVTLHHADMDLTATAHRPAPGVGSREQAVDLIAGSLLAAATVFRDRYLAIFELRMESLRRPALAAALDGLMLRTVAFTTDHHAALALDIPPERVATMVTLYGGVLFTLVSSPPGTVTEDLVRSLAEAVVG